MSYIFGIVRSKWYVPIYTCTFQTIGQHLETIFEYLILESGTSYLIADFGNFEDFENFEIRNMTGRAFRFRLNNRFRSIYAIDARFLIGLVFPRKSCFEIFDIFFIQYLCKNFFFKSFSFISHTLIVIFILVLL